MVEISTTLNASITLCVSRQLVNSLALVVLASKHFRGVEGAVDKLPLLGCWTPQHTHNLAAVMCNPMLPFLLRYNVAGRHDVLHQVRLALRLQPCTTT